VVLELLHVDKQTDMAKVYACSMNFSLHVHQKGLKIHPYLVLFPGYVLEKMCANKKGINRQWCSQRI